EREMRERIGISLQETQLTEKLTVFETVRLFRSFYRHGYDPEDLLRDLSLDEKRDARVGKLSGGQRQRLAVACALVGNPDVLFLDEPTTGLDPQSRLQLWDIVQRFREKGGTVLLTTHYMEEAQRLCDRVAIVDHGHLIELASTRTKEFVRESEALFWVFGFPLVLALALGFAFREKPPDRVPVAIVASPNAQQRLTALQKSPSLLPSIMSEQEARDAL